MRRKWWDTVGVQGRHSRGLCLRMAPVSGSSAQVVEAGCDFGGGGEIHRARACAPLVGMSLWIVSVRRIWEVVPLFKRNLGMTAL